MTSPFLDYANSASAARLSGPDTTVSFLAPRRDRARSRPLIPAPRRDIAKPLASCRSETQRTASSQDGCLVLRFLLSKNIDTGDGATKKPRLYILVAIKIAVSRKEAPRTSDANKRAMEAGEMGVALSYALGCVF